MIGSETRGQLYVCIRFQLPSRPPYLERPRLGVDNNDKLQHGTQEIIYITDILPSGSIIYLCANYDLYVYLFIYSYRTNNLARTPDRSVMYKMFSYEVSLINIKIRVTFRRNGSSESVFYDTSIHMKAIKLIKTDGDVSQRALPCARSLGSPSHKQWLPHSLRRFAESSL